MSGPLGNLHDILEGSRVETTGRVVEVRSGVLWARLPVAALGDVCIVAARRPITAEIVGFEGDIACLAPLDPLTGLPVGAEVRNTGRPLTVDIGSLSPGSVVDALGASLRPSAARIPPLLRGAPPSIHAPPPPPLRRLPVNTPLQTGVRAIDGFCTLAYGQRVGLFAPAGVGKSTLLGTIARGTTVDIVVAALVGERGREVNEFITDVLGPEGQARTIVVVSTGDEPPLRRAYAPRTATAIAEYHRRQGRSVLLLVDSLTRAARALREIGLAAGELPVRHGFTPSVYTELPRLLERAGTDESGSITAIYTVLTNEDAESDPLGDEIKSLLDGHIVLSSRAFRRGRRPAIDIPRSISRLADRLRSESITTAVVTCAAALERLERDRDVVLFGGQPDPALAAALRLEGEFERFLGQSTHEHTPLEETFRRLSTFAESLATRS